MMKYLGIFCLLAAVLGLLACSSSPSKEQDTGNDAAMGRTSVVSIGSLNLDPNKPSTITWSSGINVVGSNDDAETSFLESTTQAAIENQILHKGYSLLPIGGDYQMSALLVLGTNGQKDKSQSDSLPHSELLQKTGIDPGLVDSDQAAGKGSLVIELRQGRALRWRGAVQIYVLPEYDPAVARLRIEYAVAQLLLIWP